jgi:DNA polymerase
MENCADAIDVGINKDPRGGRLIAKLSKPRRPSKHNPATRWTYEACPQDYEDFYDYCDQDVETLRAIWYHEDFGNLSKAERRVWLFDQQINARGITVDIKLAENALYVTNSYLDLIEQDTSKITKGAVDRTSQRDKMLNWLHDQGVLIPTWSRDDVEKALGQNMPKGARKLLQVRMESGRTSTTKLVKMIHMAMEDGTVCGGLQYHGAATGRWAGRGIQPHNFMRPILGLADIATAIKVLNTRSVDALQLLFTSPMGAIASCLRAMLTAPQNHWLVVADFSAIEVRVLCWLVGQDDIVELFHQGEDVYIEMATFVFRCSKAEVDTVRRKLGKDIVLGCGYEMGGEKFKTTVEGGGGYIERKEADRLVYQGYRKRFGQVVKGWRTIESAAAATIQSGRPHSCFEGRIEFAMEGNYMTMRLPSGRKLWYYQPKVKMVERYGKMKPSISFTGVGQSGKVWREHTYGGKLIENAVQAISRDLMVNGMFNVESECGVKVINTVHDEVITTAPKKATPDIKDFETALCTLPKWGTGIPLAAEGYIARRYRK